MLTKIVGVLGTLLMLSNAALAEPAPARDGVYIGFGLSIGTPNAPTLSNSASIDYTGVQLQSHLGIRRGHWAMEPTLTITTISSVEHSATLNGFSASEEKKFVRQYAGVGGRVKYFLRPELTGFYVRAGVNRSWSDAIASSAAPMDGAGVDVGMGIQLGGLHGKGAASAFALDAGYAATWIGPRNAAAEKITFVYLGLELKVGTGS